MRIRILAATLIACAPVAALAQAPKAATYISDEEVKLINASPGVDRQIVNVDIGKSNLAVGIIHRGKTGAPAAGAAAAAPAAAAAAAEPCGVRAAAPPPPGTASGI